MLEKNEQAGVGPDVGGEERVLRGREVPEDQGGRTRM